MDTIEGWLIFVLPAITLGNLLWFRMVAIVRSRGHQIPTLWGGHVVVLRYFHRMVFNEPDSRVRLRYGMLLAGVYASVASVLYWIVRSALRIE
ncbi:MAG: hypothetical protein ACREJC_00285 [Tepidisphaeraceae bacterium]